MTCSACPQYGHSKSPYSTSVTGASSGPRMWSRSGSTSSARSRIGSAVPLELACPHGRRQPSHQPHEQPARRRGETTIVASVPSLASSKALPVNARLAIKSETVKPTPAAGAADGDDRLADERARPAQTRPGGEPRAEPDPDRFAHHVGDQDPERDRRRDRVAEQVAGHVHARVDEREQRHDHIARPRVQVVLQPFVGRQMSTTGRAARCARARASAARETPCVSAVARSSSSRAGAYALVASPIASPVTTGSMPDL